MSNEEYAQLIKKGREDLYPVLWESVRGFVALQAIKRFKITHGFGGVEIEDLIQSGYLALVSAVRYYSPEDGYSFLTVLGNCLKTEFARAGGYKTSKRDPLSSALSLDAPIGDPEDDLSLMDTLKSQNDVIESIEEKVYTAQLHEALERELNIIPADCARAIRLEYFSEKSESDICNMLGISTKHYKTLHNKGLRELRDPKIRKRLEGYLYDKIDYYHANGFATYKRSQLRTTEEKAMERIRHTDSFLRKR